VLKRRKTGFTLPIKEWLGQEGEVEVGQRFWARKVHAAMFSPERGSW
jgi:hypothetical protein